MSATHDAAWADVYACLPLRMGTAVKKGELVARVSSGKVGCARFWEAVLDGEEFEQMSEIGMWLSSDEGIEFRSDEDDSEVKIAGVKPAAFKATLERWEALLGSGEAQEAFEGDDNGGMFLGEKRDIRRYVRRAVKTRVNRAKLLRLVEFCIEVCCEFEAVPVKRGRKQENKAAALEYMKAKLTEMKAV